MHPERTYDADTMFVELEDGTRISAGAVEVEIAPHVPEPEKSYWQQNGFEDDIARICTDLEAEREQFLFNAEIRHLLEVIMNARTVEDFERYSQDEINQFIYRLRNEVPRTERTVVTFINQLTSARAVRNENIDFI